jgi:small subunit ribosomal protein S18
MPPMPPQLQCLNAVRMVRCHDFLSKISFSTTARAFAGQIHPQLPHQLQSEAHKPADTPSYSATNDLLSSIDTQSTRIQLPTPARQRSTPFHSSLLTSRRTAPVNPQGNASANERIQKLVDQATSRNAQRSSTSNVMQELKNHKLATDLTKQIYRRWKAGDVYAPHDLSSAEMQKWKKRGRPEVDAFDLLDMNPIEEYKVC